ncbi:hypothetical protein OB905_03350 [Halobacteria archaeon AArc-dxtr1]|nr:hypothetical protein [Halobacteria archaeon AArc-dxtr1]
MLPDEPSEHEPEEYDPEAAFKDPNADGLTIPSVGTESESGVDMSASDASKAVVQTFWTLVITINAAVLFVSLGSMLLVIQGMVTRGGLLILGGIALFGLAYRRYKKYETADDEGEDDPVPDDRPSDSEADGPVASEGAAAPDSTAAPETESDTVADEQDDHPE